jgi:acetoin utilization protein AcuC
MSSPVLVYKGRELAAYGFGDPHPFGIDRHDVFHRELAEANLDEGIRYMTPRRATVDELLLFHTPEYIDRVSRMSKEGRRCPGSSTRHRTLSEPRLRPSTR